MHQKTTKPIIYNPDNVPKEIQIIVYYRRFVALMLITNILICVSIVYMIKSYDRREKEFLARLKTRDEIGRASCRERV